MIQKLGLVFSILLPFFNIPLILHLIKRKSSEDLSLAWVIGVFVCLVGMFPAGLQSKDLIFKIFSIVNLLFFSVVAVLTLYYRWK